MPRRVFEVGVVARVLSSLFNDESGLQFESQKSTRTASVFIGVE